MAARTAVDVPVVINGRAEMGHERLLVRILVAVGPERLDARAVEGEGGRAALVALGDQDGVAGDDRVGGDGTLEDAGPPRIVEQNRAGGGVEPDEAAAGEVEADSLAADRG